MWYVVAETVVAELVMEWTVVRAPVPRDTDVDCEVDVKLEVASRRPVIDVDGPVDGVG